MTAAHSPITEFDDTGFDPGPNVPEPSPELVEAPARRQPGKLVELWLDDAAEPVAVRVTNRERIHYEKTAAKHRDWPSMADGQHFAMTFVCWSAAKRAGLTAATFDAFQELLLDYDVVGEEPADPTR